MMHFASKCLYDFLKNYYVRNVSTREISLATANWNRRRSKSTTTRWKFLEHEGPYFPPLYKSLPAHVKFFYKGEELKLSKDAEEIASLYAKILDHELTSTDKFNWNFFKDWRAHMTENERQLIKDLKECDFTHIQQYFIEEKEKRKTLSHKEKEELKKINEQIAEKYGFCTIDKRKEKIANYKLEPPGLFRGRGQHPKLGMLKKRIDPKDIIINCSKDSKFPKPPEGRNWKAIRHDNKVEWLACWKCNLSNKMKYIWLNDASQLQCKKDQQKYELARKLAKRVEKIRKNYYSDLKSSDMKIKQRAVALYFIDKLALRAGNEKDDDEVDTVGCCSLRIEHIQLYEEKDGQMNVVVFDFLGKDSIRYYNEISVDKLVFYNLQLFCRNKKKSDELFDKLSTNFLNKYLNKLMPGLTTRVFRTYNASITLESQLEILTDEKATVLEKLLQFNRANKSVAILCNHQRFRPRTYEKSVENLNLKLSTKEQQLEDAEKQLKNSINTAANKKNSKKSIEKKIDKLKEQIAKLNLRKIGKEETKDVALGTSKANYLDPRISVSWCKRHNVPLEKIYSKSQQSKFSWALESTSSDFKF